MWRLQNDFSSKTRVEDVQPEPDDATFTEITLDVSH
jgi:hypothetical protein